MTQMAFFTAQCKAASMMDLQHKEAAENTPRPNTVGTFISTKSQTSVRLKRVTNKATKRKAIMTRLHLKSDKLSLSSKIAQVFLSWLTSRCLKFLKFCCEEDEDLIFEIVDLSLCYPMQDE